MLVLINAMRSMNVWHTHSDPSNELCHTHTHTHTQTWVCVCVWSIHWFLSLSHTHKLWDVVHFYFLHTWFLWFSIPILPCPWISKHHYIILRESLPSNDISNGSTYRIHPLILLIGCKICLGPSFVTLTLLLSFLRRGAPFGDFLAAEDGAWLWDSCTNLDNASNAPGWTFLVVVICFLGRHDTLTLHYNIKLTTGVSR